MLEDLDYRESVTGIISGQLMNAEYAVDQTAAQFSQIFAQMDDAYMQQRASDVLDVSRRLISVLMGREEAGWAGDEPVILAADDLVPSETARLDRQRVLAFVTAQGTGSSHTAIFARTMGIPAVVGLGDALLPDYDGREVYVDGAAGEVYIDPDPETKAQLISRREALLRLRQHAEQYRGVPATTPEGKRIQLCANIGSPKDLEAVEQGDGDGIGLFRSEFLYLAGTTILRRKTNTGLTARLRRPWRGGWWWCVPWTLAPTSRPPTLLFPRRKTRLWGCGPFASA